MAVVSLLFRATGIHASPNDNSLIIYIPAWLFSFLCVVVVGMRVWLRMRTSVGLGADDYTILVSLAFAIMTDAVMLHACRHGYGKHLASLTEQQQYESWKALYVMQIMYKISMNLTKASIVLLYLRIFDGIKWFRWTCYAILAFVASFCTAVTLATIFQCRPVAAAFDPTLTSGTCIDNRVFWYTNAGVSIGTDVIILAIPLPLVFSLRISRLQKAGLTCVFAIGGFVVLTSCLRVTTLELQLTSPEPLYEVASTMWTIIEMSVAIGDSSSALPSAPEDVNYGLVIRKTLEYDIAYSGKAKESEVSGPLPMV
ncbi:hypothetical protein O1611_g6771 [Lasiodiplodia mahajangana]|uniref:Uncharacterized protein n=1 Tax=Lasiodiplodia mahajangana TaxID=1108764 RepID=A0ACC2JHU7_9PEZI|nr:hypothetical protein O1611_g6771 [Lasiodiplodia mahajangana]